MQLEGLIYNRMKKWPGLTDLLTRYAGMPAIFYQSAPTDTQKGWENDKQFPRIVFDLNTQANTERKTSGTLVISILCESTGMDPEEIGPKVVDCLKDTMMLPDEGGPYCFAWLRTDPFELESNTKESRGSSQTIIGLEIRFDLLEYPEQITTDPDPVAAINEFIKEEFPDVFVLGLDEINQIIVATEDHPIIYVRVMNCGVDYQTYALSWMNCKVAIHVIAPGSTARSRWVRQILNLLSIRGETLLSDESPLLFTGTVANNSFDYLVTGQINLDTRYSLIRLTTGPTGQMRNITIRR